MVSDFQNWIEKLKEIVILLDGWTFALSLVLMVRRCLGFPMGFLHLTS